MYNVAKQVMLKIRTDRFHLFYKDYKNQLNSPSSFYFILCENFSIRLNYLFSRVLHYPDKRNLDWTEVKKYVL